MVALLLAFLVIWSTVLFCGLIIVAMIAVVNRLNEASRATMPAPIELEIDSDDDETSARATDQETDEETVASSRSSFN
jgi:hypothetical protein